MPNFTKTEQRIIDRLSDGRSHSKDDLMAVIDELCSVHNLRMHISNLRKKLPKDQLVLCIYHGSPPKSHYQHVRLLNGSS